MKKPDFEQIAVENGWGNPTGIGHGAFVKACEVIWETYVERAGLGIDWDAVTTEIAAGNYSTRFAIQEAYHKVNEISKAQFAKNQEAARLKHIDDMKALPAQTKIFYTGSAFEFLRASGFKVKNGRDYMQVTMTKRGDSAPKIWRVPYKDVSTEAEPASTTAVKSAINKVFKNL